MDLLSDILQKRARVAVIGLGYVGLPLALEAAEAGFSVTGIDSDESRIDGISAGNAPPDIAPAGRLRTALDGGRFSATTDPSALSQADVVVVCVPTPLKDELPDMSHVEAAIAQVAANLRPGRLIILESTTYPGTTDELVLQALEASGLKCGSDFYLGFSPERIDPGNPTFGLRNVPKIVGGMDEQTTRAMEAFYGSFIDKVVPVSSPRVAEMAKLLENTYRHVNIALANEIAILCNDLGIDVWEVIDAAATKPFGFEPFYPGPGWGGHCIPVDPTYLSWSVRKLGSTARFVELAREFNKRMPVYVVQRCGEALNQHGKSLKGSRILVLGVTYKANVADMRETPATAIIARLIAAGAEVCFHDPFVEEIEVKSSKLLRTELNEGALWGADLVLIHTPHQSYDWQWIASRARLILDARNATGGLSGNIVKL